MSIHLFVTNDDIQHHNKNCIQNIIVVSISTILRRKCSMETNEEGLELIFLLRMKITCFLHKKNMDKFGTR